jgi:hypothetical protein
LAENVGGDEFLFEVETPLGFTVHVTRTYWEVIVTLKHPVMKGKEKEIQELLRSPDEIRQSSSDANVYLFYKVERERRWMCAVAKQEDGEGFLITCYPTDAIKEGVRIWPT